ncbi:hypothetical protein K493DRAFT_311759 [Basidiobolus meristosporus CBS 931.73]|uniref:Phosphoribosyltransferase domain-containing protein n=1 Tax=Basidiobolus meristosporus CBS 931.73 TaxID=1314790 RepID=A0A1Y1YZM6_9FUNG|nr:hypothetical protein K493DRAFT_311759 [Basidiobolus meristosporus CBS 931.73]|eukprot:ORY03396.1 hypothetical protein K493DRAFT_311759 [Basidiobolus meristosporus CBS 931.73]
MKALSYHARVGTIPNEFIGVHDDYRVKNHFLFQSPTEAGRALSQRLKEYQKCPNTVVVTVSSHQYAVESEISQHLASLLSLPQETILARKVVLPLNKLPIATVVSGDKVVYEKEVIKGMNLPEEQLKQLIEEEKSVMNMDLERYHLSPGQFPEVSGKTLILVADGLCYGFTMRSVIKAIKEAGKPHRIIIATPVAGADTVRQMNKYVNDVVALEIPKNIGSIAHWYRQNVNVV